jgi:tRNA pseudouridine13 synthase
VRIRVAPEDFVVDEIPLYEPSGEGDHTFVRVEKRLRTTEDVARELARAAGVRPGDVGYAGRKDRAAVTRQWFSVPGLDPSAALELPLVAARVLEAQPHRHKLRTGQLRGNRFEIVAREVDDVVLARARQRASELARCGMPNRFGAQRFGREGDNAERGRELLAGGGRPPRGRDRRAARFLVSAFQAQLFNELLAERPLPLDRVELGDIAIRHESGGLFLVEDAAVDGERAASFEISATGPIFGTKMRLAEGAVASREAAVLEAHGLPAPAELEPPPGLRIRGGRRALRVPLVGLAIDVPEPGTARLRFELPAGSYASVLLEEVFEFLHEGPGPDVS